MPFDITISPADLSASLRRQVFEYTGPASYTTGGEAIPADTVRMGTIHAVVGGTISDGTDVYLVWFDEPNGNLLVFVASTGVEVANGVDLSGFTGRLEAIGT